MRRSREAENYYNISEREAITMGCTLCGEIDSLKKLSDNSERQFYFCSTCWLIFTSPEYHLSEEEEKSRYLQHENGIEHVDYVKFLQRAVSPALPYLEIKSLGLDYGCGPSPTLSILLEREDIMCDNYDPFFYPNIPKSRYDFIFSTEAFEHFHDPKQEITKIGSLLKAGGFLVIMTERWQSLEQFSTWYYKRDPTHVCFYHLNTFDFISQSFGFREAYKDEGRVIILQKH